MKPLNLLLYAIFLFFPVILFGQDHAAKGTTGFDLFAKGKNSYTLQQTGYYGYSKSFQNGVDRGHSNKTYIDIEGTHWFGNGFGAGLGIEADWSGVHYPSSSEQLSSTWTISPSLSYGKMINDRWGAYVNADFSLGKFKTTYKSPPFPDQIDKSDLFGYGVTVAFPYRFSKYSAITPSLNFGYSQDKTDASTQKQTGFGFDVHLEDYIGCHEMKCDPSTGFKLSKNKYDQGSGFLDYDTRFVFQVGNTKTTFNNIPQTYSDKFNNANLNLRGSYYMMDYFALGGGIGYAHAVLKPSDNSAKVTSNLFDFNPQATINLPVNSGLRNLFIKGGGDFGSTRREVNSNNTTDISKTSISGYNVGIGYYAFFAEETALKICTYYQYTSVKDKDSGIKAINKGFRAEVGLSHAF